MQSFNALKVKTKLAILIALFAIGFSIYALVAYNTLNTLKVNGPYFLRIAAGKDAIADVLPPPNYIIESYLVAFQMADPTNRGSIEQLVSKSQQLRAEYDDRHNYWQKDEILDNDIIKRALLQESYEPAMEFFQIRDNQFIPAVRAGNYVRAEALLRGPMKSAYNRHRRGVDTVVSNSRTYNANVEKEAATVIVRRTWFLFGLGIFVLVFIGIGLGWAFSLSISMALGDTVGALSTTSSQMAATVEQHERTAVLQSAAVHETTTTMDELDASFNQTAEMVKVAANTAQGAVGDAQRGLTTVHQTLEGMHNLRGKVMAVSEQISNLSEQTNQIGSITRVVSDLANQTNMLALNAAVEAARAGEHGKGFGVVASEIRKLADESRKSAERINSLVEDIRKATDATVMATEEGSKTVETDIRLAEQAAQSFNDIASSSEAAYEAAQQTLLAVPQQVAAVRQVLNAMEDLNRGAKETAEGLGQTKASVESLREAAYRLKAMV